MLVFYLDDSGEERDPVVTLAGYLGTADAWAAFEAEARLFFDEHQISHLHTVDLHHRRCEFRGWSRQEISDFSKEFYQILGRHIVIGFEFSVLKRTFSENKSLYDVRREGTETTFCFKGLLNRILASEGVRTALEWEDVDLSFVIEGGNRNNGAICNEFSRLKTQFSKLKSITIEDKKAFIGLQAADFLAYFSRRLRCMDKKARHFEQERAFFMSATAGVQVHSQFLATDFFVGVEPSRTPDSTAFDGSRFSLRSDP